MNEFSNVGNDGDPSAARVFLAEQARIGTVRKEQSLVGKTGFVVVAVLFDCGVQSGG